MAEKINKPYVDILDKLKKWAWLIVLLLFLWIILSSTFISVKFGTVGVVTRFGQVTGKVMKPGLNIKIPLVDKVVKYRTQKIIYETLAAGATSNADYQDFPVDTTTSDGQQVTIKYTVRFSIDKSKATFVANKIGTEGEVIEKIVKTDSRIYARSVPRNYTANDLYTGNVEEIQKEIEKKLRPIFEDNGLVLDEFGIRSVAFNEDYVTAIETKQIEKERVKTEEFKAQQEEYKKQAKITKAQGEAESQRLQQQTLTEPLIQKMWIEKWDGASPYVTSGGGFILDLKDLGF